MVENKRKQNLLRRLDNAWRGFRDSYAGLSESEMLKGGVAGNWSVRDIIAHVTTWEQETLKHLPLVLQGLKLPRYSDKYGGIDAFNARMTENKGDLSLLQVLRGQNAIHRQLIDFIENVPEEHLSKTRFRHRLRLDTYGHYKKHEAAIRKWRTSFTIGN